MASEGKSRPTGGVHVVKCTLLGVRANEGSRVGKNDRACSEVHRGPSFTRPAHLVILRTMPIMSLAEAKAHLSEVVNRVSSQHERVTVTVHGRPSAILLAPEDLERLDHRGAGRQRAAARSGRLRRRHRCRAGRVSGRPRASDGAAPVKSGEPFDLQITATARRQLAEQLPEAVAFAAYEFICGPLLVVLQPSTPWAMPECTLAQAAP